MKFVRFPLLADPESVENINTIRQFSLKFLFALTRRRLSASAFLNSVIITLVISQRRRKTKKKFKDLPIFQIL